MLAHKAVHEERMWRPKQLPMNGKASGRRQDGDIALAIEMASHGMTLSITSKANAIAVAAWNLTQSSG